MTKLSVILSPELRLEQALKEAGIENPEVVRKLTVAGAMTEDDFAYIRENMAESLWELDMGKATVTENIIANDAFLDCTGLKSVVIPNSVVKIGKGAFSGCSGLTSLTIPDSVTAIGEGAFYGCMDLSSVVIPESVKEIGDYAFGSCYNLTSVVIPKSVVKMGNNVFSGCISLP